MNFLNIDASKAKENKLYMILKILLPITVVFKMWYLSELEFHYFNFTFNGFLGRIIVYAIGGGIAYVLQLLAVSFSYSLFYRSKYTPCDENFICKINKPTYSATCYFVLIIANVLTGLLNFFGYGAPISSAFIVILLPTIMSIFSICAIVALLYKFCEKGELKELVTSMALPAIVMLLFLR